MKEKPKGFLALLACALVFSTFGVFIRELNEMFSGYIQVAARAGVATFIALLIIGYKKYSFQIPTGQRLAALFFAISFPVSVIFFTLSVTQTKASNSVFMLYVGTIITSLLAGVFVFKEKLNTQKIISLALVFLGLVFFVHPFDIRFIGVGLIYGLLSGIFDGISNSLRKYLKGIKREVLLAYQYALGGLLAFILGLVSGEPLFKGFQLDSFLVLLIFGACLVLIGNLLLYGFSHFDVNVGTIVLASELLFALVVNYLILKESPTTMELSGGLIIFLAACLVGIDINWLKKKLRLG